MHNNVIELLPAWQQALYLINIFLLLMTFRLIAIQVCAASHQLHFYQTLSHLPQVLPRLL